MKEAVIVSGVRTAVGRAPRGTLRGSHPADMTAASIKEAFLELLKNDKTLERIDAMLKTGKPLRN